MRKLGILLITVLALSGCSSKFAYNNADWLVHWYIDDYIEFTDAQEDAFDERMAVWLEWHRSNELTQYATHIDEIKQRVMTSQLTADEIVAEFADGRSHWVRLRTELSPELAEMAPMLTDDQVIYFFAQLEKENAEEEEERREELEDETEEERLEDRVKRVTKQVEEFIGKTTPQQRQLINDFAPQFQSTYDYWLTYRRETQQVARQLFATRDNNPKFVEQLKDLMTNPDVYRSPEHVRIGDENSLLYATMLSELQASLTDKQKRKLNKELDDIIEDIEDLMEG